METDAYWRPAGSAQSDQTLEGYFPHHQYDTNYGLSESIGPGCVHLGVENIHKVGAIGKAGYGWKTRIIDENGNDVKPGETGGAGCQRPGSHGLLL